MSPIGYVEFRTLTQPTKIRYLPRYDFKRRKSIIHSENDIMLKLKSIYPIGLDIGNQHIYAAQFKKSSKGLAVRGLWHRQLNGESHNLDKTGESLVPLLKEIVKYKGFRGKKAVVHMPFQKVFTFPLRFKMIESDNLEALIARESEKYMPFPLEEAVIDYPAISSLPSSGSNQYAATIVASRRDHIEHYLTMLKQAGLSVEIFDFSVSALLRLHHVSFMPSDNPIIIGNIGHSESLLSIVTKEDILAQHHIDWGTQSLVEKLLVNFEYLGADDQARILLKKYGLYHEDREKFEKRLDPFDTAEMNSMLNVIYQIVTPHIEELIHECHQIIAYVRSEVPNPNFEAVYMYGLANMVANLDGYIEKRLQLPTTLVNPIADKVFQNEGIPTDVAEGSDFALALGLAIRKVGWP